MYRYSKCNICPRECGIDRYRMNGVCGANANIKVALASTHNFEEPCISGISGSGAGSVQTYLNQVVIYKKIGKSYLNHAYGISVFVATCGQTYPDDEYTTKDTKFTNWRLANIANGVWYVPEEE